MSKMLDTSIQRPISSQSISMVKGCMDIMFDMVYTAFKYWRALIVSGIFKVKESSLYVIWDIHTPLYFEAQSWWIRRESEKWVEWEKLRIKLGA